MDDLKAYRNKAMAYCAQCERCCSELERKLNLWGAEKKDINNIIDFLIDENFINEERFARAYVRDKFRFNKWGRIKIGQHLKLKQVDSSAVGIALNEEISDEDYFTTLNALLLAKKKSLKANISEYDMRNKLIRFAISRGFEMNIVLNCVDNLF